jgi:hypothetical protein
MRKVFAVIAAVALVSVASSWASVTVTNVTEKNDITIKGKLSPSGTAVTEADLAGNTNDTVSVMEVMIVSGTDTNIIDVIGHEINSSNVVTYLVEQAGVVLAVILLSGATKVTIKNSVTNTTVSAKIQGIWNDDESTVTGTVKSKK